jgi:hypothetical protein
VSLIRGSVTQTGVTAQKFLGERLVSANDFPIRHEQCDWIVQKSAYQISDAAVTPLAGDQVVESDGTSWEVLPKKEWAEQSELPGTNEWLIRTKRIN